MEYTDLFGEGTTFNNGVLSIPRANLEAMGLAPNAYDLVSIVTAILLSWTVRSSRKINEFTRVSAPNVLHPSSRLTIAERLSMQGF